MKMTVDKEILYDLYSIQNLTTKEIAAQLNCSTATIARILKQYEIKKDNSLRAAKISKTIQSRTEEEQQLYSQHISESRKGKGLGIDPWNKGKHVGNSWNGKHHSEETKKKISETKQNKSDAEKAEIEAKRLASRIYGEPWNKGLHYTLDEATIKAAKEKEIATKKLNNSFNQSSFEEVFYTRLLNYFKEEDIIRQYFDKERYPFACDFYIKPLDVFIELNGNWTHGFKPYDPADTFCIEQLEHWKIKAETSDYYKNAIYTWTDLDVRKMNTAIQNNLIYTQLYTDADIEEFFKILEEN